MTSRSKERDTCHVPFNTVSHSFERDLGGPCARPSANQARCHIEMNLTQYSKERETCHSESSARQHCGGTAYLGEGRRSLLATHRAQVGDGSKASSIIFKKRRKNI